MTEGDWAEIAYLTLEDFYRAAAEALGAELATVRAVTNDTMAGSALAAPSAGFGDFEKYPEFATKTAVLLRPWRATMHCRTATSGRRCCAPSSSPL